MQGNRPDERFKTPSVAQLSEAERVAPTVLCCTVNRNISALIRVKCYCAFTMV